MKTEDQYIVTPAKAGVQCLGFRLQDWFLDFAETTRLPSGQRAALPPVVVLLAA